MQIYVVVPGDNVDEISTRYGVPSESLIYANQLVYPYQLAIGQALLIPDAPNQEERRVIVANGYAYTYISPWVLEQTLPYLTELSVFSYGFSEEGYLLPPPSDDVWMIGRSRKERFLF